jgi:hypothetical protein
MYLPNGVNTLDYQILQTGVDYTFSKCLKPLERHRQHITPLSGLHHPHGLGRDHGCQRIWLTGASLEHGRRNTVSIDQYIAEQAGRETRFASVEISDTGQGLAFNRDGIRLPAEVKPGEVFRRLFETPVGGVAQERESLRQRGSVLDVVLEEARSLDRQLGTADRGRLDQYLTAVREVEVRTQRAEGWLDVPRPAVSDADRKKATRAVSTNQPGDYFRAVYDIILLAFQADLTRVVTFSTGDEGKGLPIPELAINQTRHSLSHHNGDPEQMARLTQSDAFNIEQFAYFLDRLAELKDGDTPLIDTTLSLYGSGMAYGHSHGNANLPIVVAGGAKLGIRHGRHIDFNKTAPGFEGYKLGPDGLLTNAHYQLCGRPVNPEARLSNLLLLFAQTMGVETERFADSTKPLAELIS